MSTLVDTEAIEFKWLKVGLYHVLFKMLLLLTAVNVIRSFPKLARQAGAILQYYTAASATSLRE